MHDFIDKSSGNPEQADARDVYFAGGMYGCESADGMAFDLVHPSPGNELPYLTHDPDGLKSTSHHASLYKFNPSDGSADLVQARMQGEGDSPKHVKLTDEQTRRIQESIKNNYFYD